MNMPVIKMSLVTYNALMDHLLPPHAYYEEAAFLFTESSYDPELSLSFQVVDWKPIPPNGFACRSAHYLELKDDMRASLIKRAHDLGACLVECHSHPSFGPRFSWSDCLGMEEFAPHVRWRLRGRPYAAVVVAANGFDSLVWHDKGGSPDDSAAIDVDGHYMEPTGYTLSRWEVICAERPLCS